jgi:outer membrane phospholipase A
MHYLQQLESNIFIMFYYCSKTLFIESKIKIRENRINEIKILNSIKQELFRD